MIFITVGSQKFQFNRLLKKIDDLILKGVIKQKVFAQIGYSDYLPKYFDYQRFLDNEDFLCNIRKSTTVIMHAGTGSIVKALKLKKKIIVVPRLAKFEEHVDDHQIEISKNFENQNLLCACYNINKLENILIKIPELSFKDFSSQNSVIVDDLRAFIERVKIE